MKHYYYLVNCSKHGEATVAGYDIVTQCPECEWGRGRGIKQGKLEIVEITKKEYERIEDAHWFELFGTHRYPLP